MIMRVGRVDRVPFAVGDDYRDLALALAERISRAEMRSKRPHDLRELWVVHPDFVRSGQAAARLDQRAIGVLLLRGHLVVGDFGIASESGGLGHPRLLDWRVL